MQHLDFRAVALFIAGIAGAAGAASAASTTPPVVSASSGAYGVSATLVSAGTATGVGPVGLVQGTAPPAYNLKITTPAFSETVGIAAGTRQIGTLEITAGGIRSAASSLGLGLDSVSAQASDTVGSVQMVLQLFPPPPVPEPQPLLSISASTVTISASDQQVVPRPGTVSAAAGIGRLVVSGTLVGGQTLTYSGVPPKGGLVLFSSPNLTITLNQQVAVGVISCSPVCVFAPSQITADAIAIQLNQVPFFNQLVSGDIEVGEADAGIP